MSIESLSPLSLQWLDLSTITNAHCDFCGEKLPSFGMVCKIEDMDVEQVRPGGVMVMPGEWTLCLVCRRAMGIESGDRYVTAAVVKRYYDIILIGYAYKYDMPDLPRHMRAVMPDERPVRKKVKGREMMPGLIVDNKGNIDADMSKILAHLGVSNEPKQVASVMTFLERTFGHGFN